MNPTDINDNLTNSEEKICFNCKHILWMVGIGAGVKCKIDQRNIPNRLYTCDKFEKKNTKKSNH